MAREGVICTSVGKVHLDKLEGLAMEMGLTKAELLRRAIDMLNKEVKGCGGNCNCSR